MAQLSLSLSMYTCPLFLQAPFSCLPVPGWAGAGTSQAGLPCTGAASELRVRSREPISSQARGADLDLPLFSGLPPSCGAEVTHELGRRQRLPGTCGQGHIYRTPSPGHGPVLVAPTPVWALSWSLECRGTGAGSPNLAQDTPSTHCLLPCRSLEVQGETAPWTGSRCRHHVGVP